MILCEGSDIGPTLRKKMFDLSKRRTGGVMCRHFKNSTKVTYEMDGDRLLGWSLMVPELDCIMVYVRKSERRRGLGSRLVRAHGLKEFKAGVWATPGFWNALKSDLTIERVSFY